MRDTRVLISAPQADLVPRNLLELLMAPQLDFICALINTNSTRVRAFESEVATLVYSHGVALLRMQRNWLALDFRLFPVICYNHANKGILI